MELLKKGKIIMKNPIKKILKIEDLKKSEVELLNGRIQGIQIGKSATIATAQYENLKPSYGMSVDTSGFSLEQIYKAYEIGNKMLDTEMKIESHNKLAERLEMDSGIGYSMIDGIAYAWVSSICSFDIVWRIPDFELQQYASRGKIAEAIFCSMLLEKEYPEDLYQFCQENDLAEDYAIVINGNLKLDFESLTIKEQYKQVKDHITKPQFQVRAQNNEHLYTGKIDLLCLWDKVPAVLDIKCTASLPNYNQVALYGVCYPEVKIIGYIPIGKCDLARGYDKVKMTTEIAKEFKLAIKKRYRFFKRFGF
jgi:hypothetical protein